ncbi:response regulator transcription factor [Blastomonas aquatica]|uniref:DNA-binding response regulator n=1 Tax=Blastomonas aquatica TaxID=1510276 RepID=A0ABQ1JGB4_9SPHN|nr:response regulator [Blastomonas aquatica]GGB65686.1 DNA-binding response regulator [Blastomonas aquatica]
MTSPTTPGNPIVASAKRPARRVYIIDDDSQIRKSLHFLLGSSDIHAWPFSSCGDFLEQLADLAPAPILLDIRMPEIDGLQMLEILGERQIPWPVVIMTAHGDVSIAVRAMKLGAIDFVEKPYRPDLLDAVLEQAFTQLDRMEQSVHRRDEARRLIEHLSKREREIIAILMEGVLNKEVAHRLGLSIRTVEMHRGNALAKLGLRSVAEVVTLINAAKLGPDGLNSLQSKV